MPTAIRSDKIAEYIRTLAFLSNICEHTAKALTMISSHVNGLLLWTIFSCLLLGFAVPGSCQTRQSPSCIPPAVIGYASEKNCVLLKLRTLPLKVAFVDKEFVTQNQAAVDKVTSLGMHYAFGKTCDQESTAVPEW